MNIQPTRTVYSFYFKETRNVIQDITKNYPHETYLKSISPGLDDFHIPVIENYRHKSKPLVFGLDDFSHAYYTNGASEAIFHKLAEIASRDVKPPIYTFLGEYEGYFEYARSIGLQVIKVNHIPDEKGVFFYFVSIGYRRKFIHIRVIQPYWL